MQLRQEFLVHEPKLLAKGALLENLFNQQFWLLNKKFLVRNSFGAACVRSEREQLCMPFVYHYGLALCRWLPFT